MPAGPESDGTSDLDLHLLYRSPVAFCPDPPRIRSLSRSCADSNGYIEEGLSVDLETTLKQCEDHLFAAMKMTLRERGIHYHLFRHTRLVGKDTGLFAIDPLATALGVV